MQHFSIEDFEQIENGDEALEEASLVEQENLYPDGHPFAKLTSVGQEAICFGGSKFGLGSRECRGKSYKVATFGKELGINLLRKCGSKTLMLMPLPEGEHLVISETLAYKNNRNLPSVAMTQTVETASFMTCYANTAYETGRQFFAITLPGTGKRCSVGELSQAIAASWKNLGLLEELLIDDEGSVPELQFANLETPYKSSEQSFFPHFHLIVETDGSEEAQSILEAALAHYTILLSIGSVSVSCERVLAKHFPSTIYYFAKPSTTAFEIAEAGHEKVFISYMNGPAKKHHRRSKGRYQAYKRAADDAGLRPMKVAQEDGTLKLSLEKKSGTKRKVKQDGPSRTDPNMRHKEALPYASPNSEERADASNRTAAPDTEERQIPKNVFCGVTDPLPIPGDRLASYAIISDFDPASFVPGEAGYESYRVANATAIQAWEQNTGQAYNLRDFLRPLAEEIHLAAEERGNVQYYTISMSPLIEQTMKELIDELQSSSNTKKERPEQSRNPTLWQRLVKGSVGYWDKLRRFLGN